MRAVGKGGARRVFATGESVDLRRAWRPLFKKQKIMYSRCTSGKRAIQTLIGILEVLCIAAGSARPLGKRRQSRFRIGTVGLPPMASRRHDVDPSLRLNRRSVTGLETAPLLQRFESARPYRGWDGGHSSVLMMEVDFCEYLCAANLAIESARQMVRLPRHQQPWAFPVYPSRLEQAQDSLETVGPLAAHASPPQPQRRRTKRLAAIVDTSLDFEDMGSGVAITAGAHPRDPERRLLDPPGDHCEGREMEAFSFGASFTAGTAQ